MNNEVINSASSVDEALEAHGKAEYPPMHTAEHILNQTMVRIFGCSRSHNAHIERKKSKINYDLLQAPTPQQIEQVEQQVNQVIEADMPITYSRVSRAEIPDTVPLDRLPSNAGEMLRLVHVGDYDVCACVGAHVEHTAEIGRFVITSTSYKEGQFRIVFKLRAE